jgi:hypothetical protein
VFFICANVLFYEKALSNMVRLMGSLPWEPISNLPHPKSVAHKKLTIVEELVTVVTSHNKLLGKKWSKPYGCAITSHFNVTNPYKKSDDAQQ